MFASYGPLLYKRWKKKTTANGKRFHAINCSWMIIFSWEAIKCCFIITWTAFFIPNRCRGVWGEQNQQNVCGKEIYFHVHGLIVVLHLFFDYFYFFTSTFSISIYTFFLTSPWGIVSVNCYVIYRLSEVMIYRWYWKINKWIFGVSMVQVRRVPTRYKI